MKELDFESCRFRSLNILPGLVRVCPGLLSALHAVAANEALAANSLLTFHSLKVSLPLLQPQFVVLQLRGRQRQRVRDIVELSDGGY